MKTINKMLTNAEIYQAALILLNHFKDNDVYMPAAVSYSLQKNKSLLISLGEEIEKSRFDILQHYKLEQKDDSIIIAPEYIDKANEELGDLLKIEQEVKLYCFKLEDLKDIQFTNNQMQAIMLMIEEE